MSDTSEPPAVHQTSANPEDVSPNCPFCTIASHYQPIDIQDLSSTAWDPDKLSPPGYVILSTKDVVAFLDIAPLTRGHVLVAPRKHRMKMGDFKSQEMAEIGKILPIVARAVIRSVLPDIPHEEADYNIVQNNGPGAAQVIPHVHFHVIPRPPLNYQSPISPPSQSSSSTNNTNVQPRRKYPPNQLPRGVQQSYIQFGRGRRHELDDDDAVDLVQLMRRNIQAEWEREFGGAIGSTMNDGVGDGDGVISRFLGGVQDAAWIEGSGGLVSNLLRRGGGKL